MSRINIGKVAPIPKGDWVQSQPYEKLNMVNKSGVLYIAKQDVPVNTAITNIDYWMPASGQLSIGTVETVSASTGASATITDGSNGPELNLSIPRGVTGNESIDDTKGKGDTDYVWSADKNYEEITNKAPVITETASGSLVTIPDGAENFLVQSLTVNIEPVQDLHGYDNPWPAGGGKNLLQTTATSKTESGVTWTVNADGSITVSGTATGYTDLVVGDAKVNSSMGTVTIKGEGISTTTNIAFGSISLMDSNNAVLLQITTGGTQTTYTTDISGYSTADHVRVSLKRNNNVATSGTVKIQVEQGSIATSWTPYSNICPISGYTSAVVTRTGKNMYFTSLESKSVNASGVIERENNNDIWFARVKSGRTYTFSTNPTGVTIGGFFVDLPTGIGDKTYNNARLYISGVTSYTVTVPNGVKYIGIRYLKTYSEYMIVEGSTATSYEPYQGQQVTIDLDGTRYGGSLNVLTGEMTVDSAIVDLGTLSWSYISVTNAFRSDGLVGLRYDGDNPKFTCSSYKPVFASNWYSYDFIITGWNSYKKGNILVKDSRYSDATSFKSAVSGVQLCYELATPLTVQLTPSQMQTLLGTNNIWADTGDVAVEYRADTKLYIQKLTQPTEDDMIANNNIEANKFFMLGNSLYYSTAAIAVGTSIIPGSNCTKLSLADALNNLNS